MKPAKDDYPTCAETYVTLRLYHREQSAGHVTAALNIEPCKTQKIGDTYEASNVIRTKKLNGWFLCTDKFVASFDVEKHLSYLLDRPGKQGERTAVIDRAGMARRHCLHAGFRIWPRRACAIARIDDPSCQARNRVMV
ncbi:MAG: DUF4279 domain-containing protein [Opitutaceae bacterium]|nr:DUF4279 domain-containing protein [Opitutaceae bacterium]